MPRRPKKSKRAKQRNSWIKMSKEMTTPFGMAAVIEIFNIRRK